MLELTAIFLIPSLIFFGKHENSSPISIKHKFRLKPKRLFWDWRQKALHNVPCSPSLLIILIRRLDRPQVMSTLGFLWRERHRRDREAPWSTVSMWGTTGPGNYETPWEPTQYNSRVRENNTSKTLELEVFPGDIKNPLQRSLGKIKVNKKGFL